MKITKKTIFVLLLLLILFAPGSINAGCKSFPPNPVDCLSDVGGALRDEIGRTFNFVLNPVKASLDKIGQAFLNAIIFFVFGTLLAVTGSIYLLAATLLQAVLSAYLSVGITSAQNNIIYEMWKMVRDFTNMGFVLALIAIGLGTALRISEYQFQRALPRLIIIALLINFTPIIVGFFIDAADIVINYLIGNATGFNILETVKKSFDPIGDLFQSIYDIKKGTADTFAASVAMMGFHIIGAIILLLFAWLYFFRVAALSILFILSPLAFFSYILPATKGFWNNWWKQFISWLIIGIFGAFFLLLASQMSAKTFDITVSAEGPFGDFIATILTAGLPIAFLVLGFIFTLQTSAMGAQGVISTGKNLSFMVAETRVAKRVLGGGAERIAKGLEVAQTGTKVLEEKAGKIPGVKGVIAKATIKPLTFTTWATRAAVAPALLSYAARARRISIPRGFDEMRIEEQQKYVESKPWSEERISLVSRMIEKGSFQKASSTFQERMIEEAKKLAESPYYKKEVANIMDVLPDKITAKMKIDFESDEENKRKMRAKIEEMARDPEISKAAANLRIKAEDLAAGVIHVRGLKPGDISNVAKGSLKSLAFRLGSHGFSPSHLQRLRDSFDRETVEDIFTGEGGLNTIIRSKEDLEDFYLKNPRLVHWFATSPAGAEWNWVGRRFATPNYPQFRKETDIFARDSSRALLNFDRVYRKMEAIDAERQRLIKEGGPSPSAEIRRRISNLERTLREASNEYVALENQINANTELQELLEELRRVRGKKSPPTIP